MEVVFFLLEHMIEPVDAIILAFLGGITFHMMSLIIRTIAIGPPLMKLKVWGEGVKKPFKGNYITRKTNLAGLVVFVLMSWGYYKIINQGDFRQTILGIQTFVDISLTNIGFWGTLPIAVASLILVLSPAIMMLVKRQSLWIGERGVFVQNQFLLWKEIKP